VPDYLPAEYDPLGTENITSAICQELERQPLIPLDSEIPRFDGSGLYAIYYRGETLPLYAPLRNYKIPVYVGQSLSHNTATGAAMPEKSPLWNRIKNHRDSIEGAHLPLNEFGVRLLRLPDVHADLGENGLRVFYQPVWIRVLRGFGSKEQGATTRQSARSPWDTVHPGRKRTFGSEKHDKDKLIKKAQDHIASQIARYGTAPWQRSQSDEPGTDRRRLATARRSSTPLAALWAAAP
jgi:hypothetical protein